MGDLFKLIENFENICAEMVVNEEGKLVLAHFRSHGNMWNDCLKNLVPDESKWDCPLFNPPEGNEQQLVRDFIFLIRCRYDSDYRMDVINDDPY